MTDIDYQKQLKRIAGEVDDHIFNNADELENFRDRIKPLANRWNAYQKTIQEREQSRLDHWELVKKNPKLQDKNIKPHNKNWEWDPFYLWRTSPSNTVKVDGKVRHRGPEYEMPASLGRKHVIAIKKCLQRNKKKKRQRNSNYLESTISRQEGLITKIQSQLKKLSAEQIETDRIETDWAWWKYLGMSEEKVFGCWRPPLKPLPENPLNRLKPSDEEYRSKPKELQTLPEHKDAEGDERCYIFLSSIHDNYLPEFKQITKDIWPDDLRETVWGLCGGFFGEKTIFLKGALRKVKQQAEKNSGETGNTKGRLDMSLMTPEARVLAVFADMPDLTSTEIAKRAGVNRTSLYRMKKFRTVQKTRKAEEAESYKDAKATGEKDSKTGKIEGWKK